MMMQVAKTGLTSLALGFLVQICQGWLKSNYITDFLRGNLIVLLVALLAVNSATMGIVLTKIRDLTEKHGSGSKFSRTLSQMVLSVREQIVLIILAAMLLTVADSPRVKAVENLPLLVQSLICGVFVYAMSVLYDTAMSILIITDFDDRE